MEEANIRLADEAGRRIPDPTFLQEDPGLC